MFLHSIFIFLLKFSFIVFYSLNEGALTPIIPLIPVRAHLHTRLICKSNHRPKFITSEFGYIDFQNPLCCGYLNIIHR